jgi:hypothetical protein
MKREKRKLTARLFLNDHDVGLIEVKGWDDAWGFGDFVPGEGFDRYARHFGAWSRLMHADHGDDLLHDADRDALRKVEYEIDRLHAKLFLPERGQWRPIAQLNIDGQLVEWREQYTGEGVPGAA